MGGVHRCAARRAVHAVSPATRRPRAPFHFGWRSPSHSSSSSSGGGGSRSSSSRTRPWPGRRPPATATGKDLVVRRCSGAAGFRAHAAVRARAGFVPRTALASRCSRGRRCPCTVTPTTAIRRVTARWPTRRSVVLRRPRFAICGVCPSSQLQRAGRHGRGHAPGERSFRRPRFASWNERSRCTRTGP